jgi:AcrR family transcriptional regulator
MKERISSVRSRERIVQALFALMGNDKYENISISEIAAQAGLDRRTFYRHFKVKDDIVIYYLKKGAKEYEAAFSKIQPFEDSAIIESFFTVCYKHKVELALLLKQNLSHLLLAEISDKFPVYRERFAAGKELERSNIEFTLAYYIGGLWNAMNQWLLTGCNNTPSEMATIIKMILS